MQYTSVNNLFDVILCLPSNNMHIINTILSILFIFLYSSQHCVLYTYAGSYITAAHVLRQFKTIITPCCHFAGFMNVSVK